nr:hypothetical protein [Tanacetum cinerariifolium]
DEHYHEDRPDHLGERKKFYMLSVVPEKDTVDIVVLEQRLFVIELDKHEEYVQTYNFILTHQLEKECHWQLLSEFVRKLVPVYSHALVE